MTARPRWRQIRATERLTSGTDTDERWAGKACRDEPWRWDAELDGEHSRRARTARLATARADCLTSCPALTLCREWLGANRKDAHGVVAGQVIA